MWRIKGSEYLKLTQIRMRNMQVFFKYSDPLISIIYVLFSVSGLCYLFTLIYGFFHLDWWIPVVCLILGFPFSFYLLIRPITGDVLSMTMGSLLSIVGAGIIIFVWFF